MSCQLLPDCPIFTETFAQPAMRVWRDLYCESIAGFAQCKRLELRLRGETPAPDLLPNGQRRGEVLGTE